MCSTLIVVQHCQSEHHVNGLTGGWTDTPLTELGWRQADAVAARLLRELGGSSCRLYTSDLMRASQTAAALSQALGIAAIEVPDIREINNGSAAGLTEAAAQAIRLPAPADTGVLDHRHFPHGETWREFHRRIARFLDLLCLDPAPGTPILVTHGGAVINIIAWWLRLEVERLAHVSFGTSPAGITWLTTNAWNERTLKVLSDTSHLLAARA
jgi:broad specificity phosphatase PhoE